MAVLDGCEAKFVTPVPEERKCPVCGAEVEVFTKKSRIIEPAVCPDCGYVFAVEPEPQPKKPQPKE